MMHICNVFVARSTPFLVGQIVFFSTFAAYSLEPNLKQFSDIYKSKYENLKSYKVQYQLRSLSYTKNHTLRSDKTEVYEFSRLGEKFSKKMFDFNNAQKVPDERYRTIYNAGETRYLQFGAGKGVLGRIEASDDTRAYEMGITSYFALMGLHSGKVAGAEDTQFVQTAATADMLACFARPGTVIRQDLEKVDAENCYVVETFDAQHNVVFRAWLAADKDLAVTKRETYLAGKVLLAYRVVCSDFEKYAPDLYLARRIVVDSGLPTSEGPDGPLYSTEEYTLTELSLNVAIGEDAFVIAFPPGTYVYDEKAKIEYRIDDPRSVTAALEENISGLQNEVRTVKDLPDQVADLAPPIASDGARNPLTNVRSNVIASAAGALFLSFLAGVWLRRRISKSKQPKQGQPPISPTNS